MGDPVVRASGSGRCQNRVWVPRLPASENNRARMGLSGPGSCRLASLVVPSVGMELARLDHFAGTHHGLVTRSVAFRLGVSASSWYRALHSGWLEPLFPNVARVYGSPPTFHQRVLAAVWAVGPTAMSSHRTSAALYGVERPADDPIDIILPGRLRRSMPLPIIVHRPRVQLDLRPIVKFAIPTTNPMRMLLDLAAVDESSAYEALIHILATKTASPDAIRAAIDRHSIHGRHGTTTMRGALEEWLSEELPPDSALEARFNWLVNEFDLPTVEFHSTVLGYEVDFLVTGTTVIIECDGWGSHGLDRDQFEFDRVRDGELVAAGYHIVHITWRRLMNKPQSVADQLRDVLRRWAPGLCA
jgi:very-short-patch-repair endonuclease